MIWKVVFANKLKSRKLGWIWMKLGRWGWGLKRLSLARFQRNRTMGFGESAKKWVAEALFFLWRVRRTTSATFLEHVSTCWLATHGLTFQKSSIKESNFPKNRLFRVQKCTVFVPRLLVTGNVQGRLESFHPLVDIPQIYPSWVTFAEGCTVFQLSTSERFAVPRYRQ